MLGSLEVAEACVCIHNTGTADVIGVGDTAVVAYVESTSVCSLAGGGTNIPLVVVCTVHQTPLVVVTLGEDGAVRQCEVLVSGGEAQRFTPAAVAVGAGAGDHHVVVICSVGQQAGEAGTVGGAGRHDGLVVLVADSPVAEVIAGGSADGRVSQGMQHSRGGGDAIGREHGGQTAGGQRLELALGEVAIFAHTADRTDIEVVVGIGVEAGEVNLHGVGDGGQQLGMLEEILLTGLGGDKGILPACLGVAGHPAHMCTVGGHVADSDTRQGGASTSLIAELCFRQEILYRATRTSIRTIGINTSIASADAIESLAYV